MIATEIAAKSAAFKEIYIPYPPHQEFQKQCLYLIELGRATRGKAQQGLRVLAPTGSGKTAAAEAIIRLVHEQMPPSDTFVPIVIVPLDRATTPKKLMMAILYELEDPNYDRGSEMTLKRRVIEYFERLGTLLLIIDETQHLRVRKSTGNNDVTDTLKRLLDDGVVPIVFLGTEEALPVFRSNLQLSGRMLAPVDLSPLDPQRREDRTLLGNYAAMLDAEMVKRGIVSEPAGYASAWVRGCLHEVSSGVIGRISRLTDAALQIALKRGATSIDVADLELAVDQWAIPNGFVDKNPFRDRPAE